MLLLQHAATTTTTIPLPELQRLLLLPLPLLLLQQQLLLLPPQQQLLLLLRLQDDLLYSNYILKQYSLQFYPLHVIRKYLHMSTVTIVEVRPVLERPLSRLHRDLGQCREALIHCFGDP